MNITLKESTMITPAQDLPNQRLWLSNLDLIHEKNTMPTVYLYKPNGSSSHYSFDAEVLKCAMGKVLVPFYPVAGRLTRDENGRLELNCNNEGVLFIEAETNCAIDDLGDLMLSSEILQLIPTVDYSNGISAFPLCVVQFTAFSCGGVSIGLRVHHAIADGIGWLHFINSWCDVARGLPIKAQPLNDRTILRSQDPPKPIFHHVEFDKPLTMNTQNLKVQSNAFAAFKLSPHQLNALKAKVDKYSTYQILTAHIWRCTTKARGLAGDQATKLYIAVDGRSRLHPQIPHSYFGNSVFLATMTALASELLAETLQDTVGRIEKAIKRMDDEYLKSAIDYLQVLDDLTPILRGPNASRCPNLSIVCWMRLPIYEADFGMGKPIYVRSANPLEGKGYIMPPPTIDNDGSWPLIICLQKDHLQAFQQLFYEI